MVCDQCSGSCIPIEKFDHLFYRCTECDALTKGFSLVKQFARQSESLEYLTDQASFEESVRQTKKSALSALIKKIAPENPKILDIGCSNGSLLAAIRDDLGATVHGIETQPELVAFCGKNKIDVMQGCFPHLDKNFFLGHRYDLILCIENIYYHENIASSLKAMSYLLSNNGLVIVKFHQISSLYYIKNNFDRRLGDFKAAIHLGCLRKYLKDTDLEIIKTKRFDKNFLLNFYGFRTEADIPAQNKFWAAVVKINRILRFIPWLPFALSDKIVVVLKKTGRV